MGYMKHDVILVTSWDKGAIAEAVARATDIGLDVLGPSTETINGYRTLLVCPDGSKEGWDISDEFDAKRESFLQHLDGIRYEDGSSCLEWVAISYSNDEGEAKITAQAWQACERSKKP